jgi:curli production protein
MNADADIQVWLETFARVRPSVIVPYIKSTETRMLRYRLHTIKKGPQGRSEISQGGVVNAPADVPVALSRMSVNQGDNDECLIDLTLSEAGHADRNYHFDCPR